MILLSTVLLRLFDTLAPPAPIVIVNADDPDAVTASGKIVPARYAPPPPPPAPEE